MVTEGLVFCLDGINNTGSGHDPSSSVWKDTVGGTDIPIQGLEWTNKAIKNGSASVVDLSFMPSQSLSDAFANGFTICVTSNFDQWSRGNVIKLVGLDPTTDNKNYVSMSAANRGWTTTLTSSTFLSTNPATAVDVQRGVEAKRTVSIVGIQGYKVCGMTHSMQTGETSVVVNNNVYQYSGISSQQMSIYVPQYGRINHVAIYNRVLTYAEMEQNRAYLVNRFFAS